MERHDKDMHVGIKEKQGSWEAGLEIARAQLDPKVPCAQPKMYHNIYRHKNRELHAHASYCKVEVTINHANGAANRIAAGGKT
jgi:hypothetical protein